MRRYFDELGVAAFGFAIGFCQLGGAFGPDAAFTASGYPLLAAHRAPIDGLLLPHIPPTALHLLSALLIAGCFLTFYRFLASITCSKAIAAASLGIGAAYFQLTGARDPLLNAPIQAALSSLLYLLALRQLTVVGVANSVAASILLTGAAMCVPEAVFLLPYAAALEAAASSRLRFPTATAIAAVVAAVLLASLRAYPHFPTPPELVQQLVGLIPGVSRLQASFVHDTLSTTSRDLTFVYVPAAGALGWVLALLASFATVGVFTAGPVGRVPKPLLLLLGCTLFAGESLAVVRWLAIGAVAVLLVRAFRREVQFPAIAAALVLVAFLGTYGAVRANTYIDARLNHAWRDLQILNRAADSGLFSEVGASARVKVSLDAPLSSYFHEGNATAFASQFRCCNRYFPPQETWHLQVTSREIGPLPNIASLARVTPSGLANRGAEYVEFWDYPALMRFLKDESQRVGLAVSARPIAATHALIQGRRVCGAVPIDKIFASQQPAVTWANGFYHAVGAGDRPFYDFPSLQQLPNVYSADAPLRFASRNATLIIPAGCQGHSAKLDIALVSYVPATAIIRSAGRRQLVSVSQTPYLLHLKGNARKPLAVHIALNGPSALPYEMNPRTGSIPMSAVAFALDVLSARY